jgi:hypothetical protein
MKEEQNDDWMLDWQISQIPRGLFYQTILCRVNHCIGCIPVIRPEKHVGGS